jgi:hypothetical protein
MQKLVDIKLPMCLFFYMALGLNDFDAGKSITPLLDFFGPNDTRFARCHFRAQKSLDFQGPPLPMALEMDIPASKSLRLATYKQQVQ